MPIPGIRILKQNAQAKSKIVSVLCMHDQLCWTLCSPMNYPGVPWKGCGCPAGSACEALGVPGKMRRHSGVSLRGPGRPREEVEGRGRQRLSYRPLGPPHRRAL